MAHFQLIILLKSKALCQGALQLQTCWSPFLGQDMASELISAFIKNMKRYVDSYKTHFIAYDIGFEGILIISRSFLGHYSRPSRVSDNKLSFSCLERMMLWANQTEWVVVCFISSLWNPDFTPAWNVLDIPLLLWMHLTQTVSHVIHYVWTADSGQSHTELIIQTISHVGQPALVLRSSPTRPPLALIRSMFLPENVLSYPADLFVEFTW